MPTLIITTMTIFGVKALGKMTFKIMTFYKRMPSILA